MLTNEIVWKWVLFWKNKSKSNPQTKSNNKPPPQPPNHHHHHNHQTYKQNQTLPPHGHQTHSQNKKLPPPSPPPQPYQEEREERKELKRERERERGKVIAERWREPWALRLKNSEEKAILRWEQRGGRAKWVGNLWKMWEERGLGFGGKIFQAWGLGRRQLGRGRGCWWGVGRRNEEERKKKRKERAILRWEQRGGRAKWAGNLWKMWEERGLGFGGKIFQAWSLGRWQLGRGRGCWWGARRRNKEERKKKK